MSTMTARERRLYSKARQEFYTLMPRLRRLRKPVPCDGVKWSQVALKHIFTHGPGDTVPPEGIPDKARCQRMAHWHFRALKKSWANDGNYCWTHVVYSGINADMDEEAATKRWADVHHKEWVQICERLGIDPGPWKEES